VKQYRDSLYFSFIPVMKETRKSSVHFQEYL
jgi:hypothetical protein